MAANKINRYITSGGRNAKIGIITTGKSYLDVRQALDELGLDAAKFNACVDTHKEQAKVDADLRAGEGAGVDGTPAFFINGRMISGAQPFDVFKKVIEEELKRR